MSFQEDTPSHSFHWERVDPSLPPLWTHPCRWQRAWKQGIWAQPGRGCPRRATIQTCRPCGLRSARRSERQADANIPLQTPRPPFMYTGQMDGQTKVVDPTRLQALPEPEHSAPQAVGEQLLPHHSLRRELATVRARPCPHYLLTGTLATSSLSRPAHRTEATPAPSLKGRGTREGDCMHLGVPFPPL